VTAIIAPVMSAPRLLPLALAYGPDLKDGKPGSQVFFADQWRTITGKATCSCPGHHPLCQIFRFAYYGGVHLPLSAERWIRHPVWAER
jgi:hypothetical protein